MKAKRIVGTGLLLSLVTSAGLVFGSLPLLSTQARATTVSIPGGVSIDVEAIGPLEIDDDDHDLEWSYAAKFVCGFIGPSGPPEQPAFVEGFYLTDIEILNITTDRVSLQLAAGEAGGTYPTPLDEKRIWRRLRMNEGLQFDCVDILDFLGIETTDDVFAKGWFVVRSKSKLHVTAVYMLETVERR